MVFVELMPIYSDNQYSIGVLIIRIRFYLLGELFPGSSQNDWYIFTGVELNDAEKNNLIPVWAVQDKVIKSPMGITLLLYWPY